MHYTREWHYLNVIALVHLISEVRFMAGFDPTYMSRRHSSTRVQHRWVLFSSFEGGCGIPTYFHCHVSKQSICKQCKQYFPCYLLQSSVYTSDVGFLGKGHSPSIPRIGPGPRSTSPDVGPRYPMSEVFNTSDWCGQMFPRGFRGTWEILTCEVYLRTKDKRIYVDLPHVTTTHTYMDWSEVQVSRIRLYLRSKWLATTHPKYPRLTRAL